MMKDIIKITENAWIDRNQMKLIVKNNSVEEVTDITAAKPWKLICCLCNAYPEPIGTDVIYKTVWGIEPDMDENYMDYVKKTVYNTRKLHPILEKAIENFGGGYVIHLIESPFVEQQEKNTESNTPVQIEAEEVQITSEAVQIEAQVIQINPSNSYELIEKADAFAEQKEYGKAIRCYENYLLSVSPEDMSPKTASIYFRLGNCQLEVKSLKAACDNYMYAIEKWNHTPSMVNLAFIYERFYKNFNEARQWLERAANLGDTAAQFKRNRLIKKMEESE